MEFSDESSPRLSWYQGNARHRFYGMRTNEDSTMTFSYDYYAVTGLSQQKTDDAGRFSPFYDLSGRRVSGTPQSNRIYIREGKKFVLPTVH